MQSPISVEGGKNDQKSVRKKLQRFAKHFFPKNKDQLSDRGLKLLQQISRNENLVFEKEETPEVNIWELTNALASMNKSSSPGDDSITAQMIEEGWEAIKTRLLQIINGAFHQGYFPSKWKVAKVNFLKKPNKEDYEDPSSYRPISMPSNLAKLTEIVIRNRLKWLSKIGHWISDNQHGFVDGRSTLTACAEAVNFIEDSTDQKKAVGALFIDIKAAFDSAWHPAIISALSKKNCPPYLIKIIQS